VASLAESVGKVLYYILLRSDHPRSSTGTAQRAVGALLLLSTLGVDLFGIKPPAAQATGGRGEAGERRERSGL
jgi:hypothetical protein